MRRNLFLAGLVALASCGDDAEVVEGAVCGPGTREEGGRCVCVIETVICGTGTFEQDGVCLPLTLVTCGAGTELVGTTCLPTTAAPDCSGTGDLSTPPPCGIDGDYRLDGDWPSFSNWYLTFEEGVLTDSYTDDLSAADWPTAAVWQHFGDDWTTLFQVTVAADAVIETTVHLAHTGCAGDAATVEVDAAYTVTYDYTDAAGDAVERQNVTVHAL